MTCVPLAPPDARRVPDIPLAGAPDARLSQRKSQPRRRSRLHPLRLAGGRGAGEVAERQIIDHPWVQRLRQIHQLQTAWWVFPTAEHTRFQHVVGVMHLGSRAVGGAVREPAPRSAPTCPAAATSNRWCGWAACCTTWGTGRLAIFSTTIICRQYGLSHETLGSTIICDELGDAAARRAPQSRTADWRPANSSIRGRSPF